MIHVTALTKRFRDKTAVDDLDFTVESGRVTGFVGPNGAGKSTTMQMILDLVEPTSGSTRINGKRYRDLAHPLREVGALLDARWVHPNRSARAHLQWMAATNGIPASRVDEVLELTGLTTVAKKAAGGFSLGMSQRLGIATALLGDPPVLLFDEPVNGLDPDGVRWVRTFVRRLAAEGRTILISSHLLSELAQTADDVVVIGKGKLLAAAPMQQFIDESSEKSVAVRTPDLTGFARILAAEGLHVDATTDGLEVRGGDSARVGEIACAHGVVLHHLADRRSSLEDAYLRLTEQSVEYTSGQHIPTTPEENAR